MQGRDEATVVVVALAWSTKADTLSRSNDRAEGSLVTARAGGDGLGCLMQATATPCRTDLFTRLQVTWGY